MTATGSKEGAGLQVLDCAQVSAGDCTFDAGDTVYSATLFSATHEGIDCQRSNLNLTRVQSKGKLSQHGTNLFCCSSGGIVAAASRLVLVDCVVTGGDGFVTFPAYVPPTPAMQLSGGCHVVTKGSTYSGGQASGATQEPGIAADAATQILSDPTTTFTLTGGQLTVQAIADLQAKGVPAGSTLSLTLSTSTPASYITFGSVPGFMAFPPLDIWLDCPMAPPLLMGSVNGSHTDTITVPTFFPDGLPATFQSIVLRPGTVALSTPAIVVLH